MALKIVAVGEIPSPDDDGDIVGVLLAGDWDAVREAAKLFGGEVIVSRRPAGEVREGWRPIETAPTDGTHFLAFSPDFDWPDVAWWRDGHLRNAYGYARSSDYTHWMPLPTPPEGESK